jgi:hypothetical protein
VTYSFFTQEVIQDLAQDWFEASRDDVEGNVVLDAVVVEITEMHVKLEFFPHDLEAIFERDVERAPHLLRDVPERSLACLDLFIEYLPLIGSTAMLVE